MELLVKKSTFGQKLNFWTTIELLVKSKISQKTDNFEDWPVLDAKFRPYKKYVQSVFAKNLGFIESLDIFFLGLTFSRFEY